MGTSMATLIAVYRIFHVNSVNRTMNRDSAVSLIPAKKCRVSSTCLKDRQYSIAGDTKVNGIERRVGVKLSFSSTIQW
jgi:hypothetical protein